MHRIIALTTCPFISMTILPLLPDEIILVIVEHLEKAWIPPCMSDEALIYWTDSSTKEAQLRSEYSGNIFSLILTCRRLAILLSPLLHRHASLNDNTTKLDSFVETIAHESVGRLLPLRNFVHTVTGIPEVCPDAIPKLLRLPNLKQLTLSAYHFPTSSRAKFHHNKHVLDASSPTAPNIRVQAFATSFVFLLIQSTGLTTLTYSWPSGVLGYDHLETASQTAALLRGLALHKNTLTSLTLTRSQPSNIRTSYFRHWPVVTRLDLSALHNLKILRSIRAFLGGADSRVRDRSEGGVVAILPSSVQVLEVFYDDTRACGRPFLEELQEEESGRWLTGIAARKIECLPKLKQVGILSREWRDSWSKDVKRRDAVVEVIKRMFERIGVELTVDLDLTWDEERWALG